MVTGAASGIGESCARKLLHLNATVAGLDKKPCKIVAPKFKAYVLDVADGEAVSASVDEVARNFGGIDGLVNCAAVTSNAEPFYEMSVEQFETVVSVNLTGTFLCSKYVSRKMITKRRGKIVNIGSVRSRVFGSGSADYSASKGAIEALTSAMAIDLAPFNIQVNSVAPGPTVTGMTREHFSTPEVRARCEKTIPLGRIAEPKDIAEIVLFLLSESADYLTGGTIFVDGGYSIFK